MKKDNEEEEKEINFENADDPIFKNNISNSNN
jgi:hypothetical protein